MVETFKMKGLIGGCVVLGDFPSEGIVKLWSPPLSLLAHSGHVVNSLLYHDALLSCLAAQVDASRIDTSNTMSQSEPFLFLNLMALGILLQYWKVGNTGKGPD